MWLLSVRTDHVGHGPAQGSPQAERHRHRCSDGWQHLPLRYVCGDPRGHQTGCGSVGSEGVSAVFKTSGEAAANLTRREFLSRVGALGSLVLIAGFPGVIKASDTKKYGADSMPHGWGDNPLAFLAIADDGVVTIVVHRSDTGQVLRTGMPLVV